MLTEGRISWGSENEINRSTENCPMNRAAALYAHVSTGGQGVEIQLACCARRASATDGRLRGEYVDHGIPGSKGRGQRLEFDL